MHVGEKFDRARRIIELALDPFAYISYSQFGEDLLIDVIFAGKTDPGFYVDVGAHHPKRFSNTYLLYERGWRGINIDGDPALIEEFRSARDKDINVCAVLSDRCEDVSFIQFSDSAVNTISTQRKAEYSQTWNVLASTACRSTTLSIIFDQQLPKGQLIDVLSVDVEGVDLKVLQGNDWTKHRLYLIVVEADGIDLMRAPANPIVAYLSQQGYRLHGLIHISAFFVRVD